MIRIALALLLLALAGAGCASNGIETSNTAFLPAGGPSGAGAQGGYVLSDAEKELDCKKLTGQIQIRILELRTYATQTTTSGLSRSMQSAGKTVFGGTSYGIDPNGQHAKDLALIEAYNAQLVAKDCKSYDLAKEMASTDTTPTPTIPAPSKVKAKTAATAKP